MKKLIDVLTEATGQTFDYGCVMLYFSFPEINKIHDIINPKDIYTEEGDRSFGLEDEPHTTLLFGLHEGVTTQDVQSVLDKFKYGTCTIGNASLFENKDYDVLKFDVRGKNLHETNKLLKEFPYTNSFPDYHPHLTIGYLIPGTGKKYTKDLSGVQFSLTPEYAVYSKPDGEKVKIKINVG
jgi:2'-5' RNA ligase